MTHATAASPPRVDAAPLVIGVAGGSGSGKTTVVRRIVDSLGDDAVTVLEHDRYDRDRNDLRLEERAALNYDHPDQYLGTVKPMHLEFVEPSKRYADIIIPLGGHNAVGSDMLLTLIRSLAAR